MAKGAGMLRSLVALFLVLFLSGPSWCEEILEVRFRFTPSGSPRTVSVVGSFNGWSPEAAPMSDPDGDGTWEA